MYDYGYTNRHYQEQHVYLESFNELISAQFGGELWKK